MLFIKSLSRFKKAVIKKTYAYTLKKVFSSEELSSKVNCLIRKVSLSDGFDDSSAASFIEVIKLTESRLYEDRLVTKKIEDSLSVSQLRNYADEVKKLVSGIEKLNFIYSYLPDKEVNGIPMRWFKTSEYVLKKTEWYTQ